MKCKYHSSIYLFVFIFFLGSVVLSENKDIEDSQDHPLIPRYEGSVIVEYDTRDFDEYELVLGEILWDPEQPENRRITKSENLEGRITTIKYEIPKERSTLEVYRNYEQGLKKEGFDILYSCKNKECGGLEFKRYINAHLWADENDQRYLAAKLTRPEGDVYASLYITKDVSGGSHRGNVFPQLKVLEVKGLEERMVRAEAMAKDISETGHIAIYGIYFDFDKANIKTESEPTITEIAKLLESNPELKLFVVGHTDNKGSLEYNHDLSKRRAQAVVNELVSKHDIENSRLSSQGLGFLAPVASNRTEDGRAKNRRVELVEQ